MAFVKVCVCVGCKSWTCLKTRKYKFTFCFFVRFCVSVKYRQELHFFFLCYCSLKFRTKYKICYEVEDKCGHIAWIRNIHFCVLTPRGWCYSTDIFRRIYKDYTIVHVVCAFVDLIKKRENLQLVFSLSECSRLWHKLTWFLSIRCHLWRFSRKALVLCAWEGRYFWLLLRLGQKTNVSPILMSRATRRIC